MMSVAISTDMWLRLSRNASERKQKVQRRLHDEVTYRSMLSTLNSFGDSGPDHDPGCNAPRKGAITKVSQQDARAPTKSTEAQDRRDRATPPQSRRGWCTSHRANE